MNEYPALRRTLAVGVTVAVFAVVVAVLAWPGAAKTDANRLPEAAGGAKEAPVVMFGLTSQRNMVNLTEKNMPTEWDAKTGKNVKWKAALGSKAYAMVVHGGKVFAGTNNDAPRDPAIKGDKGIVMCFNADTGDFLWQAVHDKLPSGLVHDWPKEGVCSTPAVEGNRLYYVSNRCEVVCATTEGLGKGNEGEQDEKYKGPQKADFVWRYDMMKELNVFPHNLSACSPLLVGDVLFVVTANGVDENHINIPAPEAPSFIALNKKTGQLLWKSSDPGRRIMHGQWSNPVYAEIAGKPQVIFPGGDGWIRGYEPDTGKLIWKFDCNPKEYPKYELGGKGLRSDFIATPVVHEGKVYIGTGQDPEHYEGVGNLWCIDPTKAAPGKEDISPQLAENPDQGPPYKAKPNPNSGAVWHYGGPDNTPNARRDYIFGRTMSTCAVHDGLVYEGELAGYLHCLDARTGQRYWVQDLKSAVWGSPYWVDGKVYIATEDGDVWVFEHGKEADDQGRPKKPPVKIEMEEPIRSTPAAANGVLYVLSEKTLYAIQKK
jgi:outer membrane protein assembly factor BamB